MTKETIDEKAIVAIEKEMAPLAKRALAISITTQKEQNGAGELLTQLNRYADDMEKMKKEATDPLNKTLKTIRGWFKPREEKIESAIQSIRSEMGRFQLEADKKAREEDAKIAARVAKGTLKPETGVKKMDEVERADARIDTENGGAVKFRTDYNLVIDNFPELASWLIKHGEFGTLSINEGAVKELLKAKVPVAGAHIEEKRVVVNNR